MELTIRTTVALLITFLFASASSALEVDLSNDDGWDAPGIQAMKATLEGVGLECSPNFGPMIC